MSIGNGNLSGVAVCGELYLNAGDSFQLSISDFLYHRISDLNKGEEAYTEVDELNGTIKIKADGMYLFEGSASLSPSAGLILNFSLFVNDTQIEKTEACLDFKNSQDTNTFSGTGILKLKKGDICDVRGKGDTQPVTVNICNMNINLARIGS